MKNLSLFIPITKVDEEKRLVYGIATAESPDQSGEICDYATTVPYYKAWSSRIEKTTEGKSKGNLRAMHAAVAAGKVTQIEFNDAEKQIEICAKVVDADEWNKVIEGVYTGFSQGGRYVKTWKDGEYTRYTADPSEVSLVDNPCLPTATFTLLRAGGAAEMRKFKSLMENNTMTKDANAPVQVWKATDGTTYPTKIEALKKNAELEATATAQPAIDAVAEIDKVLAKAEKKDKKADDEEDDDEGGDDKSDDKDGEEGDDEDDDKKKNAKKSAAAELKKYTGDEVFDASMAMDALLTIQCLFCGEEYEASMGEDEAGQLADLKEVIARLKSFIASEIMEDNSNDAMAMADSGDLAKKGAKISASTKGHIEKMHKSASDHMDTVNEAYKAMGMGGDEDAEKSASISLQKMAVLETSNAALQDDKDALIKTITTLNSSVETILARVKHLEGQPAPAKGALFAVEKNHEFQTGDETVETNTVSYAMPNHASPEEYRATFNR